MAAAGPGAPALAVVGTARAPLWVTLVGGTGTVVPAGMGTIPGGRDGRSRWLPLPKLQSHCWSRSRARRRGCWRPGRLNAYFVLYVLSSALWFPGPAGRPAPCGLLPAGRTPSPGASSSRGGCSLVLTQQIGQELVASQRGFIFSALLWQFKGTVQSASCPAPSRHGGKRPCPWNPPRYPLGSRGRRSQRPQRFIRSSSASLSVGTDVRNNLLSRRVC